jgi:hypothetical protein
MASWSATCTPDSVSRRGVETVRSRSSPPNRDAASWAPEAAVPHLLQSARPTHEGDALMTEIDQVRDGQPPTLHVVDGH